MKIVNKSDFFKLPAGTVYSEYKPCVFNSLFVKGETLFDDDKTPVDYIEMDLIGNVLSGGSDETAEILEDAESKGAPFNLDFDLYGRNGMYEDDQMYAVYDNDDLIGLIRTLLACVKQPADEPATAP